jgi:hypothetical protein
LNIVKNVIFSAAGSFAYGPIHEIRSAQAGIFNKASSLIGMAVASLTVLWLLITILRDKIKNRDDIYNSNLVFAVAFLTIGSLSIALTTENISEVYLMGNNVLSAILLSLAVIKLTELDREGNKTNIQSSLGKFALVVVLVVGSVGLVGRADHFHITWIYSKKFKEDIINKLSAVSDREEMIRVSVNKNKKSDAYVHSTYIMPPYEVLKTRDIHKWLSYMSGKQIAIVPEESEYADLRISMDYSDYPRRY